MIMCFRYINVYVGSLATILKPLSLFSFLSALHIFEDDYYVLPCSLLFSLNIPSSFFSHEIIGIYYCTSLSCTTHIIVK